MLATSLERRLVAAVPAAAFADVPMDTLDPVTFSRASEARRRKLDRHGALVYAAVSAQPRNWNCHNQ
jgi:hypothetical protein